MDNVIQSFTGPAGGAVSVAAILPVTRLRNDNSMVEKPLSDALRFSSFPSNTLTNPKTHLINKAKLTKTVFPPSLLIFSE